MEAKRLEENLTPSLEYTRRLYQEVRGWYKNADSKAQVILSLDGIFLTFVVNSLLQEAASLNQWPWYSLALLGLMFSALMLSLYHAISCLWSRIYRPTELSEFLGRAGVDKSDFQTYAPNSCWFFQCISALDKAEFEKRMRALEPTFEIEALSSQIYLLSINVLKKHSHVNYGFVFAAVTLVFFLFSGLSVIF